MIVATAGHIDHGKTSLVKALTGVDTDRLPEERKRGISIDLGFAHADLALDQRVSFIDVPGHERFIRNMLAGVCGIDAALLVVAADDGVMPQTLEHLHILDLLDVQRGATVITKTDIVSSQQLELVTQQVRDMLDGTSLEGVPVFPVSSLTGEGLVALQQWLVGQSTHGFHPFDETQHFRMPVDRVFTIPGSGTVITGTVQSGKVQLGANLVITPGGRVARVRSIQVKGLAAELARPGQRCALNLVGVGVEDLGRGDWVVDAGAHAPTNRVDARMRMLGFQENALAHWTPVHLHLGTMDVLARVAVPNEGSIAPGASSFVQLVIERPIAAMHGDRFVIRDQSAIRTLGGGIVLDPFAPKRKRGGGLRVAELQAYERPTPARVLAGLLDLSESGVDLQVFSRGMNLTDAGAQATIRESDIVVLSKTIGITRTAADAMLVRVLDSVRDFHFRQPQEPGIEVACLRSLVAPRLNAAAFQAFIRDLANRQLLVLSNDVARLREHEATANPEDEKLWSLVRNALERVGVHTPLLAELAVALKVKEQPLRDFLHRKSRTGEVRRVTTERFALRETLAQLATTTVEVARGKEDGFFSAADFRNAIGTGRGLAIHYLEFFDQLGITQRFGDRRRVGKDAESQLGLGKPILIPPEDNEVTNLSR